IDRTSSQAGRVETVMTANGQVRSLGPRVPSTLDFRNTPPVDRGRISILFVAGDDAALAADALPHVDVEAVLLPRTRRAMRHARRGRRRRSFGAVTLLQTGCVGREHKRHAVFGRAGEQRQRHTQLFVTISKTGSTLAAWAHGRRIVKTRLTF